MQQQLQDKIQRLEEQIKLFNNQSEKQLTSDNELIPTISSQKSYDNLVQANKTWWNSDIKMKDLGKQLEKKRSFEQDADQTDRPSYSLTNQ